MGINNYSVEEEDADTYNNQRISVESQEKNSKVMDYTATLVVGTHVRYVTCRAGLQE